MSKRDVETIAKKAWKRAGEVMTEECLEKDLTDEERKQVRHRIAELAERAADRAEDRLGW